MPVRRGGGVIPYPYPRAFCTLPSFARIKRPRWRPVELNDRHLRSHGKIGDCEHCEQSSVSCSPSLGTPRPDLQMREMNFAEVGGIEWVNPLF